MNEMSDDGQLLRQFANTRDEACFKTVVGRYIGFVYAVSLRRLRNPHSAQDATQAVFIALARKAAAVAEAPSVMGWLHRSTCYETHNLRRAQANRIARETEALQLGTISPQTEMSATAIEAVLDDVLEILPNQDREAVLARYFSGQSYAQIGVTLRLSENAARMRVDRALGKLRDSFQQKGITCTAAALSAALPACASTPVPAAMTVTVTTASFAAGAAVATGITSSLIFMSTAKIVTGAAVVLAITGMVYQYQKTNQLEAALVSAQAERAATAKQIGAIAHQLNELKSRAPGQRAPAETAPSTTTLNSQSDPKLGITPMAPKGWFKNGSAGNSYEVGVDETQPWGGMPSAYAMSTRAVDGKFGGMMQTISAESFRNQRVQLTGWVKTEGADDGGGHLWLRIDGPEEGKALGFDNMNDRAPKGTTDWQECSVVLDVPAEATTLNYGFFVEGKGKMWVNGVVIAPVGSNVSSTDMLRTASQALPKNPVNLGFTPKPAN